MIYRPAHERLWDSWLVPHNGVYYLFYIRVSEHGTRWDGISLARSEDLLHWQEYGPVLEKHPDAVWLGTGMVQRIGKRFILNFSEERPAGTQYICFAESEDLLNWTRRDTICLQPDPAYYIADPQDSCEELPRWDSLGIVDALEDQGPPYIGFVTAHGLDRPNPAQCGVLGMLTSDDGLDWRALPPATEAGLYPNYEVPEHLTLNGRHYVIFSTVSLHGARYDARSLDYSGGTYYVVGDDLQGPYRTPPGDPLLLGIRNHRNVVMAYVGRVIRWQDEYLFYHIWGDHGSNGRIGIPKLLREAAPWELGLYYWEGCEALKGEPLHSEETAEQPHDEKTAKSFHSEGTAEPPASLRIVGKMPSVVWSGVSSSAPGTIRFSGLGGVDAIAWTGARAGVQSAETVNDLRNGRIIEYSLTVESGTGAGLWFGEQRWCLFVNVRAQRLELGTLREGWMASQVLDIDTWREWELGYSKALAIRLFVRNECIEAFVDDKHALCYRIEEDVIPSGNGLFAEDAVGSFENIRTWQMQ